MKKSVLLVFIFLVFGCKSKDAKREVGNNREVVSMGVGKSMEAVYFKGQGNEPFWDVSIGKDKVIFKSLIPGKERLEFIYVKPIRVMDANIKTYRLVSDLAELSITISQGICHDTMAEDVFDYGVEVEFKDKVTSDVSKMKGCGNYIADYRLQDIWLLETLNGQKVTSEDFAKQKPYLEIDAKNKTFNGYLGCNDCNGKLFVENELLRFTDVVSTLKMCLPNNKEPEFLKALQSATTYKIENNRLVLLNPSKELLVFKKVD